MTTRECPFKGAHDFCTCKIYQATPLIWVKVIGVYPINHLYSHKPYKYNGTEKIYNIYNRDRGVRQLR